MIARFLGLPRPHIVSAVLLALALFMVAPQGAAAHPQVVRTEPEARQVLDRAPTEVGIEFNEPVTLEFSAIQVLDRARREYAVGPLEQPEGDTSRLRIALQPNLPSGTYNVIWRILSTVDGHVLQGRFVFSVILPGEPTPTPGPEPLPEETPPAPIDEQPTTPDVSPVRWLVRALALLLAAALLGGPLFTMLVLEPALAPVEGGATLMRAAQRRWSRLAIGAALGLIGLFGADMLYQVAEVTQMSPWAALGQLDVVGRLVSGTSYGLYWAMRVGAALVMGLLCVWLARTALADLNQWSLSLVGGGLIFAGQALSSHQAAAPPLWGLPIGTLSDLVHLMATGAWVGGLLYCALVLLPLLHVAGVAAPTRSQLLGLIVPRFSRLALFSVGLLVVTGFVNLALHTLDPVAVAASRWGQVLIFKHLLFLPLLALGAAQNRRVTPRLVALLAGDGGDGGRTVGWFRRIIRGEVLLASAVLLCAGALTLLPTPAASRPVAPPAPTPLPRPTLPPAGTPPPSPTPVVVTATQTAGDLMVGLTVRPELAGDRFTVRLARIDASALITQDVRAQLRVTPQDIEAGSILLPLTLADAVDGVLVYTATEPILTLAGSYEARVLVFQRSGADVKVAYRLDLAEDGTLAIRPSPFLEAQAGTQPSPAISGTVQLDLRLTDGLGAPVSGATLEVLPVMPTHAHIQPLSGVAPVPDMPGVYRTTATLSMGGTWVLILNVQLPGQTPVKIDTTVEVIDPNATPTPAVSPPPTPSPP